MSHIDNLNDSALRDILTRLRILESMAPVGFTAVTRGALRIASNEGLLVEGSAKVDGWLIVTGTERVTGLLEVLGTLQGSGSIVWTGPASFSGDTSIGGTLNVGASVHFVGSTVIDGSLTVGATSTLNGAVTLNGDLTLSSGRIVGGGLTIEAGDINFDTGGQLSAYASGIGLSHGSSAIYTAGSNAVLEAGSASLILSSAAASINTNLTIIGDIFATGDVGGGSKSFWIEHPTKPGKMLRHGSVEGPTHSVEYSGTTTLDPQGEAIVHLPDYFEALTLPEGRTVHVTPIGRPFMVGAEPVVDGQFTAYGDPNRKVSWMVKATRELFDTEPDARQSAANSVQ